jgi:hypothetical protein
MTAGQFGATGIWAVLGHLGVVWQPHPFLATCGLTTCGAEAYAEAVCYHTPVCSTQWACPSEPRALEGGLVACGA